MRKYIGIVAKRIFGRRILLPKFLASGTEASNLINMIAKVRKLSGAYLEIGVENGLTFEAVSLAKKLGVDPNPRYISTFITLNAKSVKLESDNFFAKNITIFDIVYLDGLHTYEQTLRDLINTFNVVSDSGVIIIDDTIPIDEYSALPDPKEAYKSRLEFSNSDETSWHGDVFRVVSVVGEWNISFLRIATITDLSNPKTVLWIDKGHTWMEVTQMIHKVDASEFTYLSEFIAGIPAKFMPTTSSNLFATLPPSYKNILG